MLLFNSLWFPVFLAGVALIYYVAPRGTQNVLLLLASVGFYLSLAPKSGLYILATIGTTYLAALLSARQKGKMRLVPLAAALILNLGVLAVVKYLGLFAALIPVRLSLIEPVGISFYTFQSLGYVIDVYRGERQPERNFVSYALFVGFFAGVISGPIARAGQLMPQYARPRAYERENIDEGAARFLTGLFKKAFLADGFARLVDGVFRDFGTFGGQTAALALICFALQLYFDFSGYSDMAIGAARVLGITLPENFDAPYLACSYGEFWGRWHMSLTGWFRDYLYIPLGGNRKGRGRKYLNMLLVFGLSGLWHGADWSFLVWGLLQAFIRIAEESLFGRPRDLRPPANIFFHATRSGFVFLLWSFTLAFFRADNISDALQFLARIPSVTTLYQFKDEVARIIDASLGGWSVIYLKGFLALLALALLLMLVFDVMLLRQSLGRAPLRRLAPALRYAAALFMLLLLVCFGSFGVSQFIYFNF